VQETIKNRKAYMHTYNHTYIHTYTHVQVWVSCQVQETIKKCNRWLEALAGPMQVQRDLYI
jgi:hypothetical protein